MSKKHEWTERGQFYQGTDYGDNAMVLACWCGDAAVAQWDYERDIMVPGMRPRRISHGDGLDKATIIELDYRRKEHGAEVELPNGQRGSRLLAYVRNALHAGDWRNHPYAEKAIRDNPGWNTEIDSLQGDALE